MSSNLEPAIWWRDTGRAYAPTSNTASYNNHEKSIAWISFALLYGCEAPLGGPSASGAPLQRTYELISNSANSGLQFLKDNFSLKNWLRIKFHKSVDIQHDVYCMQGHM